MSFWQSILNFFKGGNSVDNMQSTQFIQNPRVPWIVEVNGDDIVIRNATVTCFGGGNDKGDTPIFEGATSSGVNTILHPEIVGCALPFNIRDSACEGSPIPFFGWGVHRDGSPNDDGAKVSFTDPETGHVLGPIPAIDLGPSLHTGHAGDLTVAAAKVFEPNATAEHLANNFERKLTIRIHGAAKYLKV